MLAPANPLPNHELSMSGVTAALGSTASRPLVFHYDGQDVRPSYHVTEIKTGSFHALDCGANPENWQETFIQLWDIIEADRTYMTADKFLAIVGKVAQSVPFPADAKLTFEVSDGIRPMQLYKANTIDVLTDMVRVTVSARPSSCKPRDRWLEQQTSCCAPAEATSCCAGQ